MKKWLLLAAMLAMLVAVAVPAIAQIASQEFEQESDSGDVSTSFEIENSGDNSNLCPAALQFSNTGNVQNAQGLVQYGQYDSSTGDVEFSAPEVLFEPSLEVECEQAVEQAAVATN